MVLTIIAECINCDVCEPACPNGAISVGPQVYVIDPECCTECVGHHDEPQCASLYPVECIPVSPNHVESQAALLEKYLRLQRQGQAA